MAVVMLCRGNPVIRRSTAVLVLLALLAFTSIRLSPLSLPDSGQGQSVSKCSTISHKQQRQFSVDNASWLPVQGEAAPVAVRYSFRLVPEPGVFWAKFFSGRYFSLPPPLTA